ncbi:SDR family NAD(P)-dependent oxidoreductase [Actinomadura rayongensis]|uniref:SDR family NAD(P)-dependent oxidoreductase n=1 Tax=Actinomadura rayongensis TaxID=1429076 RepID=A0A6I4WH14_9ACTN|nr:SDR family NAD(P)-dependent oxidoreductase [Actinomadura rayongensis]MXQ66294.1 SDR family NAD(P)-dependent oxidoreductase [Actinomadura rayongensis]
MARSLDGAAVLLTGASSGIGRALAQTLAERGARLALAARRRALLDEVATEIAAAGRPRPHVIEADLSRPGAAADLARAALDALGTVDVLVNNAGAGLVGAQGVHGDDAAARALFETNLWSPVALTRALLPALRDRDGLVVNVTSSLQSVPVPLLGYYGASKAALAHLTRTLRHELRAAGVGVLEIVPGATDTAARDVDLLPWRGRPVRTPPPVPPASTARAITRAIERGTRRRVHPRSSLLPLEFPVLGRVAAAVAARRIAVSR